MGAPRVVTPEFRAGLVVGVVFACGLGALLASNPSRSGRRAPVVGVALVLASLVALESQRSVPVSLVVGLSGIGLVCAIPRAQLGASIAAALCVPFALFLTVGLEPGPRWVRPLLVVAASAGSVAAARTERLWASDAITPALVAITTLAVYLAVPDTEEPAVLLGVALPLALLGWPLRFATLGAGGAGASTALVVWTVAIGGRTDPAAQVGALATLALLVGLSVGDRLGVGRVARAVIDPKYVPVVVGLVHGGLAAAAARIGAAGADLSRAVTVAVLVTVASAVAGARLPPPESD